MTLPRDFTVRLNRHARVIDGGRALVGGSPTRVAYLAPQARPLLAGRVVTADSPAGAALADRLLDLGMADPVTDLLPDVDADYTVVIPVMDRAAELDRLLTSIEAATDGRRVPPVIVVDDGSKDRAAVAAIAARHGARLVSLPENVGPGGARNAGLREVTTPFVVFADSDIVLNPNTVPTLLKHFADPKVGLVAPRIVGLKGQRTWIARYEDARSSLDLGHHPAAVKPRSPVAWTSTACVVARVAALGDGFDDAMRVGEDVDLGWRLVERGWRVRYEPGAQAEHEHRAAFGDWFLRKAVYGTGAHPLSEKHPDAIAPAVLSPWSAAFLLAVMAQRRWSVPVALGIYGATALRIARKLGRTERPLALGLWLTANGVVSAGAQASALALRHWWPLAAAGCLVSKRVRRTVAVAAVVDIVLEYRRTPAQLDVVRFGIAKRLDDIAYGAGVWFGALQARSWASLKPDVRSGRR
ncbi:mycofactocin biosynthesis glycosyltransferase MftF [Sinomonas flava]|uniref:Mycofactocin biosynthesis glycosyltransferase MftF n=1 Tax=Sinomonas flava TaxID=496857 RepID=A0ABN3BS08_9MICC